MRLLILSDLHLEFAPFTPQETDADAVILAGDIHVGTKAVTWVKEAVSRDKPVIYVLGNHEYYGQALPRHLLKLKELARGSNLHVLEKDCLMLGEIVFLGCTLWTDFELFGNPKIAGYNATQKMTDYRKIRVNPGYRRLRSIDTAGVHYRSRRWLTEEVEKHRGRKLVVVTHHAPSTRSLPMGFGDDLLSAAYASNLDGFVEGCGAALWVHGHIHVSRDYMIGGTRVVCNPRGYPDDYNARFSSNMVVEV